MSFDWTVFGTKPGRHLSRVVRREIKRLFEKQDQALAKHIVAYYPDEYPEPTRVRLALLELSKGNLNTLQWNVRMAIEDYRDPIEWAEGSVPEQIGELPISEWDVRENTGDTEV